MKLCVEHLMNDAVEEMEKWEIPGTSVEIEITSPDECEICQIRAAR